MKKIFIFSILLIISIITLTGCEKGKIIDSDITSINYSYGGYNGGYYKYSISTEKNNISTESNNIIIYSAKGYNGSDLNINMVIDSTYLTKLSKVINDNKIYEWNGFDGYDKDILDGSSFSLRVEYKNGETIKASGYMKYPKNYNKGHAALVKYFESIKQ